MPWRRKWQPAPVFLPGEFHGQRSLAGCSPWGHERVRHNWVTKQQQQKHTVIKVAKTIKGYFFLNSHQEGPLESRERRFLDSVLKSKDIILPTKVHLVKAMVFAMVIMDVRVGLWRRLSTEELMLLNYGVGEGSWESLGLQGDPTSPF